MVPARAATSSLGPGDLDAGGVTALGDRRDLPPQPLDG